MTGIYLELTLIAAVAGVACALPGVFLMLRRLAMMSDAISHTVLLGIVLVFFVVRDLHSPLLLVGATVMGVVTVSLVEALHRTGRVKEDAAIGLVFPVLFSLAVLLISVFVRSVHLDTDAVLKGKLELAPLTRFVVAGRDLGPQSLYVMLGILLLNVVFLTVFYKELKLATFDPGLAAALGFAPAWLHYGLMTLVSLTAVGAFDVVGSVLVVGLMVAPAATAYLLTDRLSRLLWLSGALGAFGAVVGCWVARPLDASIAGSIATVLGAVFGVTFLLAPGRGLAAQALRRLRQRGEFAQAMLAIHLFNHEDLPEAERESFLPELHEHLQWQRSVVDQVVRQAERRGLVVRRAEHLRLTEAGRQLARRMLVS